jgi:hypothetical protein
MNMEERELLKHTYLNTITNAKPILVKESESTLRKKSFKKVSFALEKNQTLTIPYYSKMLD